MIRFEREKFFMKFAELFGPPEQKQVAGLEFLLGRIEQDATWDDIRQVAYSLATFKWETGHTFQPVVEHGSEAYFDKYDGRLGNTGPKDGFRFRGRGYVQITGRTNYVKNGQRLGIDLAGNPDLATVPATAYEIAARGMRQGWFTGRRLGQYIQQGKDPDYVNARRIINVLDHAEDIAAIARKMEQILLDSEPAAPSPGA